MLDPVFNGIPTIGSGTPSTTADPSLTAPAHFIPLLMAQGPRQVNDGVLNSTTTVTSSTINAGTGDIGRPISATGIPAGTVVANVAANAGATSITLSQPATATASGVQLTLGGGIGTLVTECLWVPNTSGSPTVAGALTLFLEDPGTTFHYEDQVQVLAVTPSTTAPIGPAQFTRSPYSNLLLPPLWQLGFTSTVANQLAIVTAKGLNA